MIDHTTHLQVSGRIADRQVEACARRLAAEAGGRDVERTSWLTDRLQTVRTSSDAILARVHRLRVRPATTLAPTADRA
jgi:hypothetical protein